MSNKDNIGIIILNYNTSNDVIRLVDKVQSCEDRRLFIYVVDNASNEDDVSKLERLDDIFLIKSAENLGYAKGNNLALNFIKKYHYSFINYVAIINPDISFDISILHKLKEHYESLENPGFISPLQFSLRGHNPQVYTFPSFFTDILNSLLITRYLYARLGRNKLRFKGDVVSVELLPGSFLFIEFSLFNSIGFFDTSTFLFCEERFVCQRLKQIGRQNYLDSSLHYTHEVSKSIDQYFSNTKINIWQESILIYTKKMRKYGGFKARLLAMLYYINHIEIVLIKLARIKRGAN